MNTDPNNNNGSGNQRFQEVDVGRDLNNNLINININAEKQKKPIERFKEALEMTDRGWQLLDSDHAKSLELFDNAKKCYEKLPEPYVMSGIWQMNNQKYDAALVSFKNAKILYEQIESLYDGIDDNDLREANLEIKKDRIAQKCEEIARIDTYIKNVNTIMKTPFPLRNLRNLFMNYIMISNKI